MFRLSLMHRWTAGVVFTALAATAGAVAAQSQAPVKLPSASGQITYKMSGPAINGTTTLSWIENGKKARNDVKATAAQPGQQFSLDGWTITDGTNVYIHNGMLGNQVMRMKITSNDPSSLLGFGAPGAGGKANSGKVVGKATILGKPCEIREMQGTKAWLWQGLPLKIEATGQGQAQSMTLQATKINTTVKLSPAMFKVPAGLKVIDAPVGGLGGGIGGPPRGR
jgi:hypothetical protein